MVDFATQEVRHMTPKSYLNRRIASMKLERESFRTHWSDLSQFVSPRKGRFFIGDRNKGTSRYNNIINSAATRALRIATSGMLAGVMSPTRPWFALETHDRNMMESQPVKEWLFDTEILLRSILNESNFYDQVPAMLKEALLFGTGVLSHVNDFDDVARFYTHTVGSYMIGLDDRGVINSFAREFEWPLSQIADKFGIGNLSHTLQTALSHGEYDKWFKVTHLIEPNDDYRPKFPLAQNKRFKEVYYETGTDRGVDQHKFLSVSGYDEFPVYALRWDVTGEDIYGTDCPGMLALGDVKQLQMQEKRKGQGIDKLVNPALTGPPSIRNVPVTNLPGGLTVYSADAGGQKLETLYQISLPIQELRIDMDAVERRIENAFFVDLFLAISNIEGIQPRNELDLTERNAERLLQLGPVLERLQGEFLNPLIDRLFNQALRAGILPQFPEELSGSPLRIRYISTFALAQQNSSIHSLERTAGFVSSLAQGGWENALDKFDADQAVDEFGKVAGLPPSVIVSDVVVAEQRTARQEQLEQAQAVEQAQGIANAAKTGAEAQQIDQN